MTLERHITDTLKEWQLKIGDLGDEIRLYYPKTSLLEYLGIDTVPDNETLIRLATEHLRQNAPYLGEVNITVNNTDRFCVEIREAGCRYVQTQVAEPEFLTGFLKVLKKQDMQMILKYFTDYAATHGTSVVTATGDEEDETILSFADEDVEPYVYCIDDNAFGITCHRFTKGEYEQL